MRVAGASVAGPRHVRSGLPNEDAVDTHVWHDGAAIAVADGVGSVTHARAGAEAAARSAIQVAGAWVEKSIDAERVPVLVHKQWQVLLAVPPAQAASTVCLVAVRSDGAWLAASIGDSLYYVMTESSTWMPPDESTFSDTTLALSDTFQASHWATARGSADDRLVAAVTVTDGIGHDVAPGRLPMLLDSVAAALRERGPQRASAALKASLERWNTPAHTDDKSIACLIMDGYTHA